MTSASLHSETFIFAVYAVLGLAVGIASILLLMLCARRKKQNTVTMIRYVKNDEMDAGTPQRTGSPMSNGLNTYEEENEKRASQHSLPNEGRNLPHIPTSSIVNDGSFTPGVSARNDASSVESSNQNSRSSPKKSTTRRLPALPPDHVEIKQDVEDLQQKAVDSTYEDLRDDDQVEESVPAETVGSGDSALYAKVPEDLNKRSNDDTDLYAQVGGVEATDSQPMTSGMKNASRNQSSSSEDDPSMDSPTAVTYASVDKMKKTMSVKRARENSESSNSASAAAPPVPERNFDEDEIMESLQDPVEDFSLGTGENVEDSVTASNVLEHENTTNRQPEQQRSGPAYETLSVRESLAHQRLRQMVEDEQRNRYVNTSQGPDGVDLYSQISEDNPEAVYESVSVPGSADGTVGVTGRSVVSDTTNSTRQPGREDGYSTIGAVRREITDSSTRASTVPTEENSNSSEFLPPPPDSGAVNPDYENIELG